MDDIIIMVKINKVREIHILLLFTVIVIGIIDRIEICSVLGLDISGSN